MHEQDVLPFPKGAIKRQADGSLKIGGRFRVDVFNREGELVETEYCNNIVVNEGIDYILDSALSGLTPVTTWNMGLKNNTSPAAGQTYETKGFTEIADYDETERPSWDEGGVSSQTITNSASPASFSINTTVSIYGAFICGGPNSATKSNSSSGNYLICVADFASQKDLNSGDTLQVTYELSGADDAA